MHICPQAVRALEDWGSKKVTINMQTKLNQSMMKFNQTHQKMNVVTKTLGDTTPQEGDDKMQQKNTFDNNNGDEPKELESKGLSPTHSDESLSKKKKMKVVRNDLVRGVIPFNNSPIKVRCLNGEEGILSQRAQSSLMETNRKSCWSPDNFSNVSNLFGPKNNQSISMKTRQRNSKLGYNSFYQNENYHIINHKGMNDGHLMSV